MCGAELLAVVERTPERIMSLEAKLHQQLDMFRLAQHHGGTKSSLQCVMV